MSRKMKVKIGVDIAMTFLMLLLMGYMVTGEFAHEWLGMGMFVLFFLHNYLNIAWYRGLVKGNYTVYRIFHTLVNFLLLLSMLALLVSSLILSRYLFAWLPIHGGMELGRNLHMAGAYWAFLLMSVHLGLHWGMVMGMIRKVLPGNGKQRFRTIALKILAAAVALYGAWTFMKNDLLSYMLLKNLFVFFDYEQPAVQFYTEYIAMMELWACIAYYLGSLLKAKTGNRKQTAAKPVRNGNGGNIKIT